MIKRAPCFDTNGNRSNVNFHPSSTCAVTGDVCSSVTVTSSIVRTSCGDCEEMSDREVQAR